MMHIQTYKPQDERVQSDCMYVHCRATICSDNRLMHIYSLHQRRVLATVVTTAPSSLLS